MDRCSSNRVAVFKTAVYICLISAVGYCEAASVNSGRQPDVYIVTPEPPADEARHFPSFVPTPLPQDPRERPLAPHKSETTPGPPDIIMAEFRGGPKNGKSNERMLLVKKMLSRERVSGEAYPPSTSTSSPAPPLDGKAAMHVKDVWDIIRHNQDLETSTHKEQEGVAAGSTSAVEVLPAVSGYRGDWVNSDLSLDNPQNYSAPPYDSPDEPRTIRAGPKLLRYPAYRRPDNYLHLDSPQYDLRPSTGEAEDRYNPAQPYLPPRPPKTESKKPAMYIPPPPLPTMPPPPVPMPPPPLPAPPQSYMNAPSFTYDYSPPVDSKDSGYGPYSYPTPDESGPPSDESGPPSDESAPPPDDSGPPSDDSGMAPHDDHGYKYEPSYPPLIFDEHPHHEHDYHELYHHHHHHPTTTTTTAAPEVEDTRVNNRFSYYYLGKKLWYLPLYFSVYFIIYVGALIIKSVARHKITYPSHYKN